MALGFRKLRQSLFANTLPRLLGGMLFVYVYCEYLIYYVVQIQCGFPALDKMPNVQPVYAMIFADPHLLGRNAHWLDKWRRDLFDEGDKCSEKDFNEYVQRFHELFKVPDGTSLYAVAGNHDVGFHYKITPQLSGRWERRMRAPPVRLLSVRGAHFVLLNSMALQGDGCDLCARADAEIQNIADILKCSSGSKLCKGQKSLENYSRPILIQHFPLYRASDSQCTEPDAAPLPERDNLFVERRDCLSKESTEYLVESLHPRLAFGGHTHHSCALRHSFVPTPDHKIEFVEYTVPSFSWRNRLDPKYYLVAISPEEARVSKCGLPREWTLQVTAVTLLAALVLYLRYSNTRRRDYNYKHLSGKKV
ncbi:metallophosphoesterase 1 homolog isoform X2 [Leguminivora glycinivorella]|uniref:metallophosphoesterase 1 homolog isoform X2 n=1 Tax=Leguminivora glycinivorella TaxID=1035111 RepID=UPI00200CE4CA|nr:metallophosphoesterase 1 homolog isoform X2 [Leguminivora glycinivorella]